MRRRNESVKDKQGGMRMSRTVEKDGQEFRGQMRWTDWSVEDK